MSSQLTNELIHYDFASQGLKDFSSLLAVNRESFVYAMSPDKVICLPLQTLRALFIALSYEAEPKLSQETAQFITELRNQIIGLIQSTPSTSGVSSVRTHSDGKNFLPSFFLFNCLFSFVYYFLPLLLPLITIFQLVMFFCPL